MLYILHFSVDFCFPGCIFPEKGTEAMAQLTIFDLPKPMVRLQQITHYGTYLSPRHSHTDWQLTAAIKGIYEFTLEDKSFKLHPGEWILISPMIFHDFGSRSKESVSLQIFLQSFPPDLMPEFAARFNYRQKLWRMGCIQQKKLEDLRCEFESILSTDLFCKRTLLTVFGLNFISSMLVGLPKEPLPSKPILANIRRSMEFMEKHYREQIGISEFAAAAELSESHFAHIFQQQTGVSPMAYFNYIRLGFAEKMLLGNHTVEETAAACGFSSAQYFCRFFRKNTGRSPKSYQKSLLG